MDDDVVFFAMVQRYNIYFKYVSLHHDILGSHGAKSSTENIYWAQIVARYGTIHHMAARHRLLQIIRIHGVTIDDMASLAFVVES